MITAAALALGACGTDAPMNDNAASAEDTAASSQNPQANTANGIQPVDNAVASAPENGAADSEDGDGAMAWRFNRTAAGPKLAYGEPRTDNVRLNLRCDGGQVTLHFMRPAEVVGRRPDKLTVASGGTQWRTDVSAEESQLGGMSISATAPASSAPMTAFASGRPLEVRWGDETIRVPGTDKARQFLSACE